MFEEDWEIDELCIKYQGTPECPEELCGDLCDLLEEEELEQDIDLE
jgi:hypothetical protein